MSTTATTRPPAPSRPDRPRRLVGIPGLLGWLGVLGVLSLAVGSQHLGWAELRYGLTHRWATDATGLDPMLNQAAVTVQTLRIPRTLLAVVAGAALGVAGGLTQGHTRNAIAEPGLLGVSAGSALAAALGVSILGVESPLGYVWLALVGGAAATALVFGLSSIGPGRGNPLTLVLLGAGITAFLSAVTLALTMTDFETMERMRRWWVGSVSGRSYDTLWITAAFVTVGLVMAFASAPTLNLLGLGDDAAAALGIDVGRARLVGLAALTLLVGAVTAACGPITLLGLMAPHLARSITGPDHRWLLPYAALIGAGLLLTCDILGRFMAAGEVPVGVVTALVGGPFFILLVRYRRLAQV